MGSKTNITLITAALACCLPFIKTHEGNSLKAYEDVVGVWTICNGVTIGTKPGMTKTQEQCDELSRNTLSSFMSQVSDLLKIPVMPETLAAHASFAYNIGINGYTRSSALRLTNQGKLEDGCRAMIKWITAGGKDCRIRANNCYGVVSRRIDEINLCLMGVKHAPLPAQ